MNQINRQILRIALPSIVSNITVPLLGLVDVTIVGHMGDAVYIGAIAVGSMIFNVIYWIFGFLRMGTSGMTSQSFGRRDLPDVVRLLLRSLTVALVVAALIILFRHPILSLALRVIGPSPDISVFVRTYYGICVWGAPAMLCLYGFTGWFIGMQNTRIPMFISIMQNVVNIAASLSLVYVFGMKVEGVALGTLIAQYAGLLAAVVSLVVVYHVSLLQCQPRHLHPHLVHRGCQSVFPFSRSVSRCCRSGGKHSAHAAFHAVFIRHGWFRLCRRGTLRPLLRRAQCADVPFHGAPSVRVGRHTRRCLHGPVCLWRQRFPLAAHRRHHCHSLRSRLFSLGSGYSGCRHGCLCLGRSVYRCHGHAWHDALVHSVGTPVFRRLYVAPHGVGQSRPLVRLHRLSCFAQHHTDIALRRPQKKDALSSFREDIPMRDESKFKAYENVLITLLFLFVVWRRFCRVCHTSQAGWL